MTNDRLREKEVEYSYFFKRINDVVYKFFRIGKGEWRQQETPYKDVPYIYWSNPKEGGKVG